MRQIIGALLLTALVASASLAGEPSASPDALLSRISKEGGREVLWQLWDQEQKFDQVLSGVESGQEQWLNIATALRPFADGAASLSIDYAVARALPREPDKVLSLVGHGFELDQICTSPYIEPEPEVAEAYERQALAALASVKDPSLVQVAAQCAQRVRLPQGA